LRRPDTGLRLGLDRQPGRERDLNHVLETSLLAADRFARDGRIRIVAILKSAAAHGLAYRLGEQPEQQFARITLPHEEVERRQIDRAEQGVVELLGLEQRDVEIVSDGGGAAEHAVAEDRLPVDVDHQRARSEAELRQAGIQDDVRAAADLGKRDEVQRDVLAGTDDVEEDAFVAGVRRRMIDVLVARLDMIDDGACAQYAGRQRAGRNTPRTITRNNTHNTPPPPAYSRVS